MDATLTQILQQQYNDARIKAAQRAELQQKDAEIEYLKTRIAELELEAPTEEA
jgi:hypothetical protein